MGIHGTILSIARYVWTFSKRKVEGQKNKITTPFVLSFNCLKAEIMTEVEWDLRTLIAPTSLLSSVPVDPRSCWLNIYSYDVQDCFLPGNSVLLTGFAGKVVCEVLPPPLCCLQEHPVFGTARLSSSRRENILYVREIVCTWEQAYPIKASPLTRFRKNTAKN